MGELAERQVGILRDHLFKPQPVFPHTMTSIFIYGPNEAFEAALIPR